MAKKIFFTVPATPDDQSDPVAARLEQSATLVGARQLVSEVLLADIGLIAAPQELAWEVEIDGTQYYWLTLLSAINEQSQTIVIGPQPAVGKVIVEVWTIDAIGVIQAGCKVRVVPVVLPVAAEFSSIVAAAKVETDTSGYAAVELYADSGAYKILIANKEKNLDTAGKAGQVLNWIDLL